MNDDLQTYSVTVVLQNIVARDSIEAAKEAAKWLYNDSDKMVYNITNDSSKKKFTVDLWEQYYKH